MAAKDKFPPEVIRPQWLYQYEIPASGHAPDFEELVEKSGDVIEPEIINMRFTGWLVNPAHGYFRADPGYMEKFGKHFKRSILPVQSMFTIGAFIRTGIKRLLWEAKRVITNKWMEDFGVEAEIGKGGGVYEH